MQTRPDTIRTHHTRLPAAAVHRPAAHKVRAAIEKRSFATLSTVSPVGHAHVAGVLYECVADALYLSTMRSSRKARNAEADERVGVCIPIRRLPIGPPSTVLFQSRAVVLGLDDPEIRRLVADGHLRSITEHGELEIEGGCFIRIPLPSRLHTYGLGMSLRRLVADPLTAGGVVDLGEPS